MAVAFNNNAEAKTVTIPVWEIGISDDEACQRIFETTVEGHSTQKEVYPVQSGTVKIKMKPFSAVILKGIK